MPGWVWTAREKHTGKEARGWSGAPSLERPDQLEAHLKAAFPGLDFSQFKCEQRDRPPDLIRPMPGDWILHGIQRLIEEVEEGRRPNVTYSQIPPPLPDDESLPPSLAGAAIARRDGSAVRIVSIPKALSLYRPRH